MTATRPVDRRRRRRHRDRGPGQVLRRGHRPARPRRPCGRCTTCRSPSDGARSSASWAPTAPARAPRSGSCSASCTPRPAGATVLGPRRGHRRPGHPRARRLPAGRHRLLRLDDRRRGPRLPRPAPRPGRAAARRADRAPRAVARRPAPPRARLLARHAPEGGHHPGDAARPGAAHPRRAHRGPGPADAARRSTTLLDERRRAGRTVFFSSHILSEVERVCDRVAIIRHGELVALSDVDALLARRRRHVEIRLDGPAARPRRRGRASATCTSATGCCAATSRATSARSWPPSPARRITRPDRSSRRASRRRSSSTTTTDAGRRAAGAGPPADRAEPRPVRADARRQPGPAAGVRLGLFALGRGPARDLRHVRQGHRAARRARNPLFEQFSQFGGGDLFSLDGAIALGFIHPFTLLLVGIMAIGFPAIADRRRAAARHPRGDAGAAHLAPRDVRHGVRGGPAVPGACCWPSSWSAQRGQRDGDGRRRRARRRATCRCSGSTAGCCSWPSWPSRSRRPSRSTGCRRRSACRSCSCCVNYLADVIGSLWPDAAWLRGLVDVPPGATPRRSWTARWPPATCADAASSITAVAVGYALVVFPRRDLAAPAELTAPGVAARARQRYPGSLPTISASTVSLAETAQIVSPRGISTSNTPLGSYGPSVTRA